MLYGKVPVTVGDRSAQAAAGESFYFNSDRKHTVKNVFDGKSKILWVSCPPTF